MCKCDGAWGPSVGLSRASFERAVPGSLGVLMSQTYQDDEGAPNLPPGRRRTLAANEPMDIGQPASDGLPVSGSNLRAATNP